jgi:hypothetical protein
MGGFYDIEDALSWASLPGPQFNITQNQGAASGPVWGSTLSHDSKGLCSNIMFEADVNRMSARTPWFRTAPNPVSSSPAEFNQAVPLNIGVTCVWTGTASQSVGNIWLDYEIEAIHAQYPLYTTTKSIQSSIGVTREHLVDDRRLLTLLDVLEDPSEESEVPSSIPFHRSPRSSDLVSMDI